MCKIALLTFVSKSLVNCSIYMYKKLKPSDTNFVGTIQAAVPASPWPHLCCYVFKIYTLHIKGGKAWEALIMC